MATLGPESAAAARPTAGSQLASAPLQSHIGGVNLPHNRGLERALEEAAASGVLSLSARKLKEFPRTAANHDLTDTVEAALVWSCGFLWGDLFLWGAHSAATPPTSPNFNQLQPAL